VLGLELVVARDAELVVDRTEELMAADEVVDAIEEELELEFELEAGALKTEYAATAATPTMIITIIAITRGAIPLLFCNMAWEPQSPLFKHLMAIKHLRGKDASDSSE
jgi:hypothetical protein